MSFGRKGVAAAQQVPQSRGFGRTPLANAAKPASRRPATPASAYETQMSDEEILAKRQAFLAAERAAGNIGNSATKAPSVSLTGKRPTQRAENRPRQGQHTPDNMTYPASKRWMLGEPKNRSIILAYVFWYFASALGMHRFYCGHSESGWYQLASFFGGLVLFVIWPPLGLASLGFWFVWIIVDLFLIPGMMRRFKAQHDDDRYTGIFD